MAHKIRNDATTKLSQFSEETGNEKVGAKAASSVGLLNRQRQPLKPKSFRLSRDDVENLKKITREVNLESRQPISETQVVKALIQIGTKTPSMNLLKALGELF